MEGIVNPALCNPFVTSQLSCKATVEQLQLTYYPKKSSGGARLQDKIGRDFRAISPATAFASIMAVIG